MINEDNNSIYSERDEGYDGGCENQAIIEAMRELHGGQFATAEDIGLDPDVVPAGFALAVLPQGMAVSSLKPLLDSFRKFPERRTGIAKLQTLQSIVDHANRFKDDQSALFAHNQDGVSAELRAVYDYHEGGSSGIARHCAHGASYAFPTSPEWLAWHKADGKPMSIADFAEFLEERIVDVFSPAEVGDSMREFANQLGIALASPAQLMTLSRGLSVHVEAKVSEHRTLSSGEGQLHFDESHKGSDGQPVKVPGGFVIAIPVFVGGPAYQLPVRLRYRVRGGGITWECHLSRTDAVFRDAFEESCRRASELTSLPLFYGRPE